MKTFKRALSVLLATAMILTTFFIFDPAGVLPTAEAAVSATDPVYGEMYFIVPEAIYLSPRYNSYNATTSSVSFQWYVNNTLNKDDAAPSLDVGESGTGKIAFRYPTATNVRISFKWQSEPGSDINAAASITYGDGQERVPASPGYQLGLVNGYGSTMVMWGNSPSMTAETKGVWICWIATYIDTADGLEKQAYAFTYVYKPYVAPIAVGIRGKNTRGSNHYASYVSWISGVHGVAATRSGATYPNTNFLPFSSSAASGVELCNLNLTLASYFSPPSGNQGPGGWFSGSSSNLPDATGYTYSSTTSSHSSGDDYVISYAYSSTGKLTVDSSRYQNLNEVPNLSVGLMVTDDEDSNSGGAYFISNFYGHTDDPFNSDFTDYWHTSSDDGRARYWDPLFGNDRIAEYGNWNNLSAPEGEGVKFNERWRRDISNANSGTFYVGTGYANQQNGDKIYDVSELRCSVTLFNRSALREAYFYAMKTFPVNNLVLLGETESWRQFIQLYREVARWLCQIDCGAYQETLGYNTAAKLANALKSKTDQIKSLSNTDRLKFLATQFNVKVYEENGKWKLSSVNGKTSMSTGDFYYHRGARVEFSSEVPTGYRFAGYYTNVTLPNPEASTMPGELTYNQPGNIVTTGEYIVEHADTAQNCTYYYVRNEYTIEYDLAGGVLDAGVVNPDSFNVESSAITLHNPSKSGYTFAGWTGSNGETPQTSVTIPAGSTGNKTYTANWSAHSYIVHYDGNGATFGNTPDSEHTFGVSKELSENAFYRVTNITYHYNDAEDPEDAFVEEIESAGFEFAGWNTQPNGSGTGFTNRQSVVDLTTANSITLYAQWNAIQDVLPSPTWDGYGFVGWYSDPNFTSSSYVGAGGAAFIAETDIDLYGKWEEHVYTIHYNGNGATSGTTPNSLHHTGRWEPLTPNGFKREYTVTFDAQGGTVSPASTKFVYAFKYWTPTEVDNPYSAIDPETNPEVKDLTTENSYELYAQWQPRNTTVVPPTPERSGFTFDGWYMDQNCTTPTGANIVPVDNMTLYARWTPTAYLIDFDVAGGTAVSSIPYTTESNATLPSTSRTGYTFGDWKPTTSEGNWEMDRTYAVGTSVRGKFGSVTLRAQWTPINYMITFEPNGGNPYPDSSNQMVYNIESAGTIGEPIRNGYSFDNWVILETGGNWENTGTLLTANELLAGRYGNVYLSATWAKDTYTITFDAAGGTPIDSLQYEVDSTGSLPAATRNGYTFVGWKPDETSGSWDADMTYLPDVTKLTGKYGDVTLVAQWSLAGYMLTFDERGGEEVPNMYYTTQSTTRLGSTTRPAYTFGGWKPKATVGNWDADTVYQAGMMLTGMYGAAVLVAQWNPITYTVTFDTNGAGNYPDPDDPDNILEYNTESQQPLGAPEREGFTFQYWVVTATDGNWTAVGTTYKEGTILAYKYGNVSLRAEWKSNGFPITYNLGEGASLPEGASNPTTYTVDNPTFTLINPIRRGYEFTGWIGTDLDGPTIDVTIPQGSMGERSYTATWSTINYVIQYTLYDGVLPDGATNPTSYTIESETFTLTNPVKTGYVFAGWEGTDLDEPWVGVRIPQGSIGDRNYRATWVEEVYTITYDLQNGVIAAGHENPTSFTISSALIQLTNPTREGYTFAGWTGTGLTEPTMRVFIPRGSIGSRTFTANWNTIGYTITYNLQGGALADGVSNPEAYNVETPTFTLNNPTKEGYDFAGWTGTGLESATTSAIIIKGSTGDRSYTATWGLKEYTLSYILDNGTLTVQNPVVYTIESETFTLNNPTKTGFDFVGWTLTENDEPQTTVTIEKGSTGSRIYTAHWSVLTYSISYDLQGGALEQGVTNPESYSVDSANITLNNPVKDGYTFAGWTGSNGFEPQTTVFIAKGSTTGDKNYTANWTPVVYTITYRQLFPGSTTPVALEMVNETTYTIETPTFSLNKPTSDQYIFDGWTGSNGDEMQTAVTIEQGTTGNLTFIAHWGEGIEYTITYNLDGGQFNVANPETYTVRTAPFSLNAPVKPGYTFTGWTGTGLTELTLNVIIANETGNRVYLAHWVANTYYVRYRPNGGTGQMSDTELTYDSDPVTLSANTFARTGSTFLGWAYTENAETPDIYSTDQVRNLTTVPFGYVYLYAVWEVNLCTLHFEGNGETGGTVPDMTDVLFGDTVTLPKPDDPRWPRFFRCDSTTDKLQRTFLGWTPNSDDTIIYEPGAEFLCQGNETFYAVWSANYYYLNTLIRTVERYRSDDAVPANENDEAYAEGGEYAETLGSDGNYPWDCFDMTQVERRLAEAKDPDKQGLPQSYQTTVNALRSNLSSAVNSIVLKPADETVSVYCNHFADEGCFYDMYNDVYYPPCEDGNTHSYQSLKNTMDALFNANNANILYTEESVQELRDIIYGNNFDQIGLVNEVQSANFKKPAQGLLDEYTMLMAEAYHTTLKLKDANFVEFDKLITEYLPSLHDDVTIGQGVTYTNLETYYTVDTVAELKAFYEDVKYGDYTYKNVEQWLLEDGGDIYMMLRDLIDALEPVDADYQDVFYEILSIPTGTEGFEYPAPDATVQTGNYLTWIEWARSCAGDISSQMDTDFLSARYTENSVMAMYRVLDAINWDLNKFEQDDINGRTNITSYKTLLHSAIDGLKLRKYTVTYKYNDETDAVFTTQGDYNYGDVIGSFPVTNPRRTDYIFRGWTLDPDDETPATVEERVYGNMSLYAIWTSQYTITYDFNGGTAPADPNPTQYADTDPDILLNNPTRDGYTFAGWTGSNGDVPNTTVIIPTGSTGSREYTANWLPIAYDITYNLDGGTATNPTTYTIEDDTFTLNKPTKTGYAFAGWIGSNGDEPQTEVSIELGSMGEKHFTATWTASGFTLTYILNGGALPDGVTNPTTYTIDTPTFTLNNPERAGCTFDGWTEPDVAEPQETVTIEQGSTGDRTFTAVWTASIFTITYDLAQGALPDGVSNTPFFTVDSATFTLNNPTRFGYDFTGWIGTGLDEPTIELTIEQGSTGSRRYTATWAATEYPIHYELDGGTSENPAFYTIEDDAITLLAPTKAGYAFDGWTGSNGDSVQQTVTIPAHSTGERSYTAHWTIVEYTITYELDGGTLTQANPTVYTVTSRTFTLNYPTRRGYRFDGWTGTDLDEMSKEVTIEAGSTGDRAYTAHWTIVEYTLTYDLAGGALADGETNPTAFTVETETFTLLNPTKESYDFAGWIGTGIARPEMVLTIDKGSVTNRNYTATWTPTVYSITYDLKGGALAEGLTNPETYTIETETFALNVPSKSGCTFEGWIGSNGTVPQPMVLVNKGSSGNKSYTAKWNVIEYTISYNLFGGTAENPTAYTVESDPVTLQNPTRRGYDFTGWTGTELDEQTVNVTIATGSTGNRRYSAHWQATRYAISYNLDGGTAENPDYYTVESSDIVLNAPTKAGYDFAGWTGSNGTDPQKSVTIPSGSFGEKNYKANWTAVEYAITYELDGGTANNPASYTIETETFTLNAPTKAGYTFAGWTGDGITEPQMTVTVEKGSTGEKTFTAHWQTENYTITYNLAGGALEEGAENPTGYTIESDAITLQNPTKTGYTFAGWTGTGLESATETVTIPTGSTGNRTYTATYTAIRYTITYELDGGTAENPAFYTIETETFALNAPTKAGYSFAGWTGDNGNDPALTVTITQGSTGNKTFTANWSAEGYTISYNLAGGTAENPTEYTIETATFTLQNPTKNGYDFAGWTGTGLQGPTETVTIAQGSTGNRRYTATWEPTVYTIDYDLAGGAVDGENPGVFTIESDAFTLINPTKTGYTFAGWTGTGLETAAETVTIAKGSTGSRSYTATWTAVEYAITYELDGGTANNPASYTVDTETFALNAPTKAGYTFAGWTGDNGSEPQTQVLINKGSTGTKSFTAHWNVVEYTIGYDLAGGAAENPTTYTVESDPITLQNPTKRGYDFAGWTGTGLETATETVTIETGSIGNRNYTATWTKTVYTIDYDLAGGAVATENPATYTIESDAITLNNPTKEGYDFAGWTGSNGSEPQKTVTIESGSVGTKNYTANWTAVEYAISYDLDGGTAENPATYTIETETFTLNAPTKAGYTFAGWTGDGITEPQMTVTVEKGTMGALSFTATWSTDGYTITYDLDGGAATNPESYTVETATFKLNNPTKTGYTFTGWTGTDLDGLTIDVIIDKGSTGNRDYTANWTPITYLVEFHSNTAADESFTMEYTYDTSYPTPDNQFANTGAAFQGWSATGNGEPLSEIYNLTTENNGRVLLFAIWQEVEYTLTFDVNGATDGTVEDMGVAYGQKVTLPDGADLTFFSDETQESRTFLGWTANGTEYAPGAEFTCPADNVTFTAIWSANYYALDKLVEMVDAYREDDAVPANANDPKYQAGGELAVAIGSDGTYAWDNFDMTQLESKLAEAKDPENRGLTQADQSRVNALTTNLQNALDSITLLNVDYDAPISCTFSDNGFYDMYHDVYYPPCENGTQHSYNSLLAAMNAIFDADDADRLYTEESVQALHDVIYGNNFDTVGIVTQVQNAAFKKPAQVLLGEFVSSMAKAYHETLELKGADYTALDKLITEYLPSLHNDVEAGQNVTYTNLETYYTTDSAAELRAVYDEVDRNYNIAEQWLLEEGGDVYDAIKNAIDALVPVDADYINVFYEILTIPTGTEGFEYPAPDATRPAYPTWIEWARENAGSISSQMDTEYLNARFTEGSVANLNRVLDMIEWDRTIFEQDDVDGRTNITSYKALLKSAIDGLKLRKYSVTYMLNNGTDESFTTQSDYNYGDNIGSFPATNPQRTDYVFKGWTLDPESTEPVSVEERIYADMTLYAIWGSVDDEPVELVAKDGSTTVIDKERGFIYGLDFNLTVDDLTNDYLDVIGNGHLEYSTVAAGTGTVVTLFNDYTGEPVETYVVVIFGDLDGDGTLGPNDMTQMRALTAKMVNYPEGSAQALAADVNHDGMNTSSDYTLIRSASARLSTISQTI